MALNNARVSKSSKENYQQLLSDIEETNRKTSLVTIEIGSLGHSLPTCHNSLRQTLPNIMRSDTCNFFDNAARIAISTSYTILLAGENLHWPTNRLLLPWPEPSPFFLCFFVLLLSYCPSKISFVLLHVYVFTALAKLMLFWSMLILCPRALSLFLSLFF